MTTNLGTFHLRTFFSGHSFPIRSKPQTSLRNRQNGSFPKGICLVARADGDKTWRQTFRFYKWRIIDVRRGQNRYVPKRWFSDVMFENRYVFQVQNSCEDMRRNARRVFTPKRFGWDRINKGLYGLIGTVLKTNDVWFDTEKKVWVMCMLARLTRNSRRYFFPFHFGC